MSVRFLAPLFFVAAIMAVPALVAGERSAGFARRFEDGRFVDPYYGISYRVDGLEKRQRRDVLFAGSLAGGGRVQIRVDESVQPQTAAEWRAAARSAWAKDGVKREGMVAGEDSFAPLRFIQHDPDKGAIHHGYAWYVRGRQVFVVHVAARQKGEATAALVAGALAGLSVKSDREAFRHAADIGRRQGRNPRSPAIVIQAAARYAEAGEGQNLPLAREAALAAERAARTQAKAGKLSAKTKWMLVFYGASVHLGAGEYAEALASLDRCLPLAAELEHAKKSAAACHFERARAYAGLGRLDESFAELKAALAIGSPAFEDFVTSRARSDPSLASLRADPRWKALFE